MSTLACGQSWRDHDETEHVCKYVETDHAICKCGICGATRGRAPEHTEAYIVDSIRSGVCPYCGAAYTLAAGGCVARCQTSEQVRALIADAADYDELRDPRDGEP